ncbi:DUF397 domain-containing protein [Streptomyces decoyicus]|uniref:DUF397 domain-containing protein n=1 Tax=Streptomyces decoyicus TaxID=249567 RepID=A0ABZ1F8V8_9ACTN|nr:DUF397 domain-containing protein [Streptomyces decoyicus]WSB66748.1 DUF397 domain-containing protein [Streptomyces decoyicus]
MAQQHAQRRRLAVLHTADFDVLHHGHAADSPPSPDDNAAEGHARPSRPRHDLPDKAEAYGSGCCVAEPVQPCTLSAEPALRAPRPEQAWRKSSHHSGGGNCIVATAFGAGTVAVHDSKNPAWTRPVRRLRGDSCPVTAHALPEGCCGEPAPGPNAAPMASGPVSLWPRLHERLPVELRRSGLLEMDDAAVGGSHV